jgi:hypothetical protein
MIVLTRTRDGRTYPEDDGFLVEREHVVEHHEVVEVDS